MSSRARRTAAMTDAAITSVDAKRSCCRRSCSSRAVALRISPINLPRLSIASRPGDVACRAEPPTVGIASAPRIEGR
jgi:hypothetical protein